MAIVDSPAFALSDVITELGLPTASSLSDCFANANASSFDPTYEGSKDRLSNFRNYGGTCDAETILAVGYHATVSSSACSDFSNSSVRANTGLLSTATILRNAADCSVNASVGYYSDGSIVRYWDGTTLGSASSCPAPTGTAISISTIGRADSGTACGDVVGQTKYNDGGVEPIVGDFIYNEVGLTTKFNGGSLWYRYDNSFGAIQISSTGEVLTKALCFAP